MRYLLAFALLLDSVAAYADDKPTDIHAANKKLGRGINLGNALEAPKEGEWGVKLKPEYFQAIKKAGFDTVRLPVKWSAHAQKDAPYTIDAPFAERVDWAIDQALANQLNIIVNVHHYGEMDADPDAHLSRLLGLWEQIAPRYKDKPASVYFEFLNEPHDKLTEVKWNAAIPQLLAVIRKTNPTRPVIVGPGQWNSIRALDKLELPSDDHNLILTIHYYDPFQFTHQKAHWVKGADKWPAKTWTATDDEQAAVRKSFNQAAAWAKAHDRPVFLGEFGAYSGADMDSRARWTHFIVQEALNRGFSFTYWEFCSGFGAYDPQTDAWREPLKAALTK
jgi:endoglucanase